MSDLIERKAAIDAIRCDITITGRQNAELVAATIGAFADRIKALPSAQPEIVRCKDCRYYKTYQYVNGIRKFIPKCSFNDIYVAEEDFCSQAERRKQ